MTLRLPTLLSTLAAAALLAACSSPVKLDEPKAATPAPVTQAGPSTTTPAPAQAQATPQSGVTTVDLERQRAEAEAAARASAALANLPRVIYFDYDSFLLHAEDKPVLEGYAKALSVKRDIKMSLQGHADERGGREYNLALGQKRAEAVARALELLGVNASQLEAVSFGKERPADPGHTEAAWAKNRRVELKDR